MDLNKLGSWSKLKVLGTGGFGQVTLWYNTNTHEKIAIKKLHEQSIEDDVAKAKQSERWCKEVEIMKKLNHANVVSTLKIPDEFNSMTSLPLLAMEYCSQGDLRGVLSQPENCSGLRESEILDILRDVSSGLAYLHTCKIIHRDLKPENIVLKKVDSKIVYKLIDLGYAKAFDQNSLSQSFVGTIQYVAPELFLGKAYTSSVDYWSFGLVAHEIVTGFRPFLPGFSPSDWMKQVKNKDRNVVCVMEKLDGSIIFSTKVSERNHVSRVFLKRFEKWLRLALDWDGQARGRDPDLKRLVIFEELTEILCFKAIKIFSLATYETLAYEFSPHTDISELKKWIREDTGLETEVQLLLFPNGKALNEKGNLLQALRDAELEDKISIYLYDCGVITVCNVERKIPQYVADVMESAEKVLKYRHLKRYGAESINFLQKETIRYRNLLRGIEVKISSIKQKTLAIESMYEDVNEEWGRIESFSQFLSLSHKIDLENYIRFRKTGKLKASPQVQKWIQNVTEVEKKINELKNSFNKNEQKQLVLVARQRCRYLDNHSSGETLQKTPLDDIVCEAYGLWEKVQKLSGEERENPSNSAAFADLVGRAIEETNTLLNSEMLRLLFRKITEAEENLAKFLTRLTAALKSAKILKLVIENTQRERQMNVWNMVMAIHETGEKKIEENGKSVAEEEKGNVVKNDAELACLNEPSSKARGFEETSVNGKSTQHLDFDPHIEMDASTIIKDNHNLRYRIQEVHRICDQMVGQMKSFKLDFICE